MSLQAAERIFATSPEAALALVTEAKESSSRALTELRDLVRGTYPPVRAGQCDQARGSSFGPNRLVHAAGMLRAEVTDDGSGFPVGAHAARGTSLAGVERRLATFDGILAVSSPSGGPTIVVIEVPCASSSQKLMAEARSNAAIGARLFITEKAVSKHAAGIFGKLDLAPSDDDNRRVLAVLAYLDS